MLLHADKRANSATFFFIALLLQSLAKGQLLSLNTRLFQQPNVRHCSNSLDCRSLEKDEICYWLFDGCSLGNCMCDPRSHVRDSSTRKCKPVRRINEACDTDDTCVDDLICDNGTCQCPHRIEPTIALCLHPSIKLLGQQCIPFEDTCYHKAVYGGHTHNEVECHSSQRVCQCKEGYVREAMTCRRTHIGETGCRRHFHCEGGAVCVDERCACPTGYKPVAHNTKCARIGATTELPLGMACDEIQEDRYCAHGLICHKCHEHDRHFMCVKYLPGFDTDRATLSDMSIY